MGKYVGIDVALNCAVIEYRPQKQENYIANTGWMSAPSVAVTSSGRIWLTVNLGGQDEGGANLLTVSKSDDGGMHWDECVFSVDHPDEVRIHEPLVWSTPDDRIIVSWIQSYQHWDGRGGLWYSVIENADGDEPNMTEPYRLCDGVMATCPCFTGDGKWILPIANWKGILSEHYRFEDMLYSMMYVSTDNGKTVTLTGKADVPESTYDEHSIVSLSDGSLMMIVRTSYGWGYSRSFDGGHTWTEGAPYRKGPSAKSCMRNLPDGRLLWTTYDTERSVRERIAAWISEDNGETWPYRLLLDDREKVSYPDVHICEDGTIYITHDYDRYGAKEVVLHRVTVADIEAGKLISHDSYIGHVALRS